MSFVIEVASSPDRDTLVAEIWWNDQMVAEVRQTGDGHEVIDLYPCPSGMPWSFGVGEWLEAVKVATSRLG
jgi:hypothetical protein